MRIKLTNLALGVTMAEVRNQRLDNGYHQQKSKFSSYIH